MRKTITVQNISPTTDIQITVGQTETAHIELPMNNTKGNIPHNSSAEVPLNFDGGCSTLFVWSTTKKMLWCGIIPIGSTQPLIVDPDTRKVSYSGVDLPECPEVNKREYFGNGPSNGSGVINGLSTQVVVIGIVGTILIILLILFILRLFSE